MANLLDGVIHDAVEAITYDADGMQVTTVEDVRTKTSADNMREELDRIMSITQAQVKSSTSLLPRNSSPIPSHCEARTDLETPGGRRRSRCTGSVPRRVPSPSSRRRWRWLVQRSHGCASCKRGPGHALHAR